MHTVKEEGANGSLNFKKTGRFFKLLINSIAFIIKEFFRYGVYESIFGTWSWTNSSVLLVHCYFNVWQRAQVGWRSYKLRQQANQMIERFPKADADQLRNRQEVCTICFQVGSSYSLRL